MITQLGLFDQPVRALPFQPGSDTSRAAAERALPNAAALTYAVLDVLVRRGEHGATDEEIFDLVRIAHPAVKESTVRARRVEQTFRAPDRLTGRIRKSGETRRGRSGNPMTVWVVS